MPLRLHALLLLALSFPKVLPGQTTTATIQGRVIGANGSVVPGAQVEIRSCETGAVRQTVAGVDGAFLALGLAPGSYDITGRAVGYRPVRRNSVELLVGDIVRLDFTLTTPLSATELDPVIVTAHSASDIERKGVSSVVVEREIERLPLNGRNALGLSAIAPGVQTFGVGSGVRTGAPASGMGGFVNLYVDGVELKGMVLGGLVGQPTQGSLIPQEAIREFRVALNPYDAEFTRGAAWVMSAVTHHGSNDSHGSIFAFGQNRDLVARATNQLSKPEYQRSQFGGNLRGALVHDRLFYALSYEGQLTDNYTTVVPPRPALNPSIWDRYAGTFQAPFRNQLGMARLTALLGAHTFDAMWSGRRLTATANFGTQLSGYLQAYDAGVSSEYRVATAELRDRWTPGAAFINELSLSLLSSYEGDEARVPGVTVQYPGLQVTGRVSYPVTVIQRFLTLAERPSYTLQGPGGQHSLKAGVEISALSGEGFQPSAKDGLLRFPTDTSTLPSLAQIGVGYPDAGTTAGARAPLWGMSAGAYVQDEWRPNRSLSLTVGLRYDADVNTLNQGWDNPWARDTTLQRVAGARYLDARHRKNDLDNLAPRIAATWDPRGDGRTSLRAGYGIMYDRTPRSSAFFERVSWGWRTYNFTNPGTTDPAELRRRVVANQGTRVPSNLTLFPERMETAESRQWSAGVGHRLTNQLTLQMDYLDQHLLHLPVTVRTNVGQRILTSQFGPMTFWGSFGDASYRGLLTSLTYDRGASRVTAAYTLGWSHAEFIGVPIDANYPDTSYFTMQWANTDERHRLVVSGMTDGPFGLQFSTIAIVASPHPYAVIVGTDVNRSISLTDDWPNGIRVSREKGWAYWYRSADIRIGKAFGGAHGRLIATADVFNVFNTANHSEYSNRSIATNYRQPINDYARRQAQVGLRYQF